MSGAARASPEPHLPRTAVPQIDFAVPGPKTALQCLFATALALEACQNELDVLAGAEIVRSEVRTRTEIVTEFGAANGDAVAGTAAGVGDTEFGRSIVLAEILEFEFLRPAELPS
jgi:hypothetical protein